MKEEIQSRRYEPPEVEVWYASVEVGFAGSDSQSGTTTPDMTVEPL